MMSGKIAPNQGHEIDNLLAGRVPLISFKNYTAEQANRLGVLVSYGTIKTYLGVDRVLLVVPYTTGWRNYCTLYDDLITYAKQYGVDEFYHTAMGRLHGYSDDDIREFLTNPPECDCSQCKGL